MRTRVYVDGFNLYYGALKGTPFKWLNPVDLARRVLPAGYVVDKLLYFTARISGAPNQGAPARQPAYITALRTLPEVEVHFGSFLSKLVWRPLINLPVADRQINAPQPVTLPAGNHTVAGQRMQTLPVGRYAAHGAQREQVPNAVVAKFCTMEEKGSDVNLAAQLLNDAWNEHFEAAAVISNDTDLVTPGPHGDRRAREDGYRRVSNTKTTGCAGAARRGEQSAPCSPRDAEGGAVSGYATWY